MDTHFVGSRDVLRFPRLKESDHAAMVEDWNDQLHSVFPTWREIRIHIGKRLFLIKSLCGHGKFRRWFNEQGYDFGFRSAEKYMCEALEYYKKSNTNNYSYCPVPLTDVVHEATAKKKAEFDGTTYQFILSGLTPEEVQRLKLLRETAERVKAHAAVITALQPWLRRG
jgi:hypothetical protein